MQQRSAATVAGLLARLAAAPCLCVGDRALDGAQLREQVERAARWLLAAGFRPGDRLALFVHRTLGESIAILAAMLAGGIAVPIHPKLKDAQVAHVLADCAPWGVVTSATKVAALRDPAGLFAAQRLFHLDDGPLPKLAAQPFGGDSRSSGAADGIALPAPDPAAPAALLYTSGSTGFQKGIVQNQQNLVDGARIVAGYLGLRADDHILALLPFSFDYGLNQLLSAIWTGCRITAADHLGIGELGGLLQRLRPTGLAGVPPLWHELARALRQGSLAPSLLHSLRYLTNSGGRLQVPDLAALRQHAPQARVFSMYGLTEAFRSAYLPPELIDEHPTSFGRAIPEVELLLVDGDGRVIDGPGTGELVHAGALIAAGYWRNAQATAERFRADPRGGGGIVVFSGDLVRRDAEGLLYFVGRRDQMLKLSGHRVSPDEIAAALAGQPGVGLVAVFGADDRDSVQHAVVVVQGDPADRDLVPRLQARCRQQLPSYMLPARIHVLPELPLNQNGKVDVRALAERFACIDNP